MASMDIGPLHIDRLSGNSVEHYGRRITPQHLVVRLDFPGSHGGIIFNRAIAVRIDEDGLPPRTLPVLNYTRLGQVIFLGIAVFASIVFSYGRKP
jgi:hypothetical protein